ncbi:DUF1553 domain-containing protein [Tundrisphaera lichenicola]|uniref:DUF1553 domain-containing protein n=1 Tax=Tundrisphaera lichenicola TaxID=2029860 RepID=UPI003EB6D9B2
MPISFSMALLLCSVAPGVDYSRDIKPVLARRCFACHGPLKQKAGLRLDSSELIRRGGDGGPSIEPGHADESLLVERLAAPEDDRMPPEGAPLTSDEIRLIRGWIDGGAVAPADTPQPDPRDHWSFRPPKRPEVPSRPDSNRIRNPIDAFLGSARDGRGLQPVPPVEPGEWFRRVSLDLIGLAPRPEEIRAFEADLSPDAYVTAVDRLLASPRYGERWGRHWMDIWRYSDWAGFGAEVRESQPHIWRWRDWIVESLNLDKGYDRMIVEMLAADEAAPGDADGLRATGYLARSWYKFNRNSWLQNTVEHSSKSFLGLTIACARCHDHKYDPISQVEYYRYRAFFEPHDVRTDRLPGEPDIKKDGLVHAYDARTDAPTYLFERGDEKNPDKDHPLPPGLPAFLGGDIPIEPVHLPITVTYPGLQPFAQAEVLAQAESGVATARAALDKALLANPRAEFEENVARIGLAASLWNLESVRARIAADRVNHAEPRDSKLGDILAWEARRIERQADLRKAEATLAELEQAERAAKPSEKAKAGESVVKARETLESAKIAAARTSGTYSPFGTVYPTISTGRRLALARRIVGRENPLAARVAVNHIWLRHFGRALVPTVFDFGLNGTPPSHPELLDWLATEFMDRGWSLKAIHRLIVTSDAYRMQSTGGPDHPSAAIDPGNAFYWRMNPRRMESEAVRDNVLHVAGRLDFSMGGPDLEPASGLTSRRRSLYFRHAAEKQMLFLSVFDAPNVNACYRRDVSVVPQQALAMANSPLALANARYLARDLSREVGETPEADGPFLDSAFDRVLGRSPSDQERKVCREYLASQSEILAEPEKPDAFQAGPACEVAPSGDPHQRARESLIHVLINHHDFVTIR